MVMREDPRFKMEAWRGRRVGFPLVFGSWVMGDKRDSQLGGSGSD